MTDFPHRHRWWNDAARLYMSLITRKEATARGVPRMTLPKYAGELDELRQMSEWIHWNFENRVKPRPHVWAKVPVYAYTILREFEAAHPHPPHTGPPPPSAADNPPSRWKNAPWTKKFVACSHGLRSDDGVWTPDQLVQRARQSGCGAVFAQIGDPNIDPDWAEHCRQLVQAGHQAGLQVGAWGRADYDDWPKVRADIRSVMPLDGFKADVEQRCLDPRLPEHLAEEFADEMPLAVVATGGIDDAFGNGAQESAKRFGDYFDMVTQAYRKDDLPLTPDSMENWTWWRSTAHVPGGYRHMPDANNHWQVPMGMSNAEGTPPMADQVAAFKPYSPHIGWWNAEIIEAHDEWGVWASL